MLLYAGVAKVVARSARKYLQVYRPTKFESFATARWAEQAKPADLFRALAPLGETGVNTPGTMFLNSPDFDFPEAEPYFAAALIGREFVLRAEPA